ncbi:tyrosine-type recombinase/integrase [Aquincola tertiaricarbonis]|uniref:tyrosine-type recombinase/integrase n=1 Tax=Aquincola tertiaricarbonis TaxID=391953 RepID=UPI0035C1B2D0
MHAKLFQVADLVGHLGKAARAVLTDGAFEPLQHRAATPATALAMHGRQQPGELLIRQLMKRFFSTAADVVEEGTPALAEKLRQATPHWTRHTHATHLLQGGAELTTVRDNLRLASLATTSMYLHTDDARRAKQVADRFAAPRS